MSIGTQAAPPRRRTVLRYGLAVVTVALAAVVRYLMRGVLPESPFLFFFAAVTISAWVGGIGPGATATLLSVVLGRYLFIEPVHTFQAVSGAQLFRMVYFMFQGMLTSTLFEAVKRALAKASATARQLRETLTQRDAAEQSRHESELRFGALADAAPVLIWMSGIDKMCNYLNKGWLDFVGRPLEQEVGKGRFEGVHPEDLQRCTQTYSTSFDARQPFLMDYRLRRADGQYRWISDHGTPRFTPDGQFRGYIGACVDIHDRREIEQRIAAIVDNAVDGIITIDEAGLIESFNPAAEKQFGYPRNEVMGKNVRMLMPPPHHDDHNAFLDNYLGGGTPRVIGVGREVEGLRKDGSTFPMDLSVSEVQRDGRRTFTGIVHDVTERKLAHEQLNHAKLAAETANRQKDQFLAMVSHELRTPLTAIMGWAELLSVGAADPDELAQGVETIARNARVQSRLIEDLLDISRIISGKLRLDVRDVAIDHVVDAAIDSMKHAAQVKQITLHRRTENGGLLINADAARLQQVVWNLLSNAIKFTPAGGAVDVQLARDDGSAVITVSDNGPGIDPQFLPQMFHRFHQADSSSTRKHGGLGLGLSIARHLTELHGGTIQAHNATTGTGAILTVRVPIAGRASADVEPDKPKPAAAAGWRDAALEGVHVLLVDDEQDALDLLSRMLQRSRAKVTAVSNAADALEAIRQLRPDVLVSDIAMPGEDGYALIRRVRQLAGPDQQIPAAALTAFARAEDRRRALQAGFQAHIAKPVEPAELTAVVAGLAGRGQA